MIEKALKGDRSYWGWIVLLLVIIAAGIYSYLNQLVTGLTLTGMGRDVSWGVYIAQFTFLVGVAASAVMVVLPYYLHDYKAFGKIVIIGEFLAVAATIMCVLFILVDLGRPDRVLNVLLYPTPNSMLFWDATVLNGYLLLNIVSGWTVLGAERKGVPPPKWVKPVIYLSIPWAFSIHTVTAFLYAGLPGRHLWLTAVLAPRFLASAFAAGILARITRNNILSFFISVSAFTGYQHPFLFSKPIILNKLGDVFAQYKQRRGKNLFIPVFQLTQSSRKYFLIIPGCILNNRDSCFVSFSLLYQGFCNITRRGCHHVINNRVRIRNMYFVQGMTCTKCHG